MWEMQLHLPQLLHLAGGTLGIIKITAGANKARVDAWADVGSTDRRLLLTHGNTGNRCWVVNGYLYSKR